MPHVTIVRDRLCEAWSSEFLKWYSEQDALSDAPLYLRKLLNNQTPAYGDGLRAAVAAMADMHVDSEEEEDTVTAGRAGTMTLTRLQQLVVHVKQHHDFPTVVSRSAPLVAAAE